MATKRTSTQRYQSRIQPYLEEWGDLVPWQQFRNWSVQQILWDAGLSDEQVEDITQVDGQRDEGIDAWYVDESNPPTRLVLIQSKATKIAKEDFSKMKDGLRNLLDPDIPKLANRALLEKASLFRHSLPKEFEVDLYLTSSHIAQKDLEPNPEGDPWRIEELSLLGRAVPVYLYVRDIKFLVENVQTIHENPIVATFQVEEGSYFQYTVGGHTRTVTAALRATDLANIFLKEKQNLFRRNPRYYLGTVGLRNAKIKSALEGPDKADFYIFNNGLTCVAARVRVDPAEDGSRTVYITAEDFQIVNGCQTTATLAEVGMRKDLRKVQILAKIIENPLAGSEGDGMADLIAERSNSQNPLKAEDWKANDRRQKAWHNEFLEGVPDKWFYEIKRGTWTTLYRNSDDRKPFKDSATSKCRKVTMKDLGQECWAFLGHPGEAKDRPRDIFNQTTTYDLVFRQDLTATQLLLPHIIYQAADAKAKAVPQYELPPTDPEYDRLKELSVATIHLRHPIVAAVGRVLSGLKGVPIGYLTAKESAHLIENRSSWLQQIVDGAFEQLARRLLLESAKPDTGGARAIVRSNDWMNETLYNLTALFKVRVDAERTAGAPEGTLAHTLKVLLP